MTDLRPHALIRATNVVARAMERVGLPRKVLSPERAIEAARRATKLDDFGPDGWQEGLERLVASFERDAHLTPVGRGVAAEILKTTLARRLEVVAELARHPGIAEEPVRRPVFIVGLPRTGSTFLLRLLVLADDARPLRWYEAAEPVTPQRHLAPQEDPRLRRARRSVAGLHWIQPRLRSIHTLDAAGAEECLRLMMRSLCTWTFPLFAETVSYVDWLWSLDVEGLAPAYRFHRSQLQLLQWNGGGGRWTLKSPVHTNSVHALLRVYPDACIVQTHRALDRVLPSACSLTHAMHVLVSSDPDPVRLGQRAVGEMRRFLVRQAEIRAALPGDRLLDLAYDDLVRDPIAAVERIHAHFGLAMTEGHRMAMERLLDESPRRESRRHVYTAADYGLDAAEVAALQREYGDLFGPLMETPSRA